MFGFFDSMSSSGPSMCLSQRGRSGRSRSDGKTCEDAMVLPAVVHVREIHGHEWRIHQLATNHFEIEHEGNYIEVATSRDNWPNPPNKKWTKIETAMKWLDRKEKAINRMKQSWEDDANMKAENKKLKRRVAQLEKQVKKLTEDGDGM